MRSDLDRLINGAAKAVYRRFMDWADKEDLQQELWVWVLENEKYVDKLTTNTLKRRLYGKAEKYARKEKAARSGYEVDDEFFYSMPVLREFLPWAIDTELPSPTPAVNDRNSRAAKRAAVGPGMDLDTMVADVRRVYAGLGLADQRALRAYVAPDGHPNVEDVNRALRMMQRALGGRHWRTEEAA